MTACDAVRELLAAHALGALESTEATLVSDHLRDCVPCREAERQARADLDVIEAPDVAPPAHTLSRIRQRIAAGQAGDEPVRAHDASDPAALIAVSCSFCRGTLARADSVYCASCLAPHHPDCWREYGRCSVMGCAEQRVVRPTERPDVAPHPVSVSPGPSEDGKLVPFDEVRRRRRSRRLLGGGLLVAITGGLAAAGLQPTADPVSLQLPDPIVAVVPATPPTVVEPRWDVFVRDASLAELCAALEREAGAKIDLSAGLTDALVREGRWRARTWRELLRVIAAEQGLVLREGADRIGLEGEAEERATATLVQRTTQLLELTPRWRLTDLRSGSDHQVAVAPVARALALLDGRTVRVLARGQDSTFTFRSPVRLAAWRDDGARLAILCAAELVVLTVDDGRAPSISHRHRLASDSQVSVLTWSPDGDEPFATFQSGVSLTPNVDIYASTNPGETTDIGCVRGPSPGRHVWGFSVPSKHPALDVDLARSRLLVVGDDARLYDLRRRDAAAPEQVGEPILRRALSPFSADLAPDGARVAWIDGGLLFVRRLAADGSTEGVDAQVIAQGSSEAVMGCAWRGDGHALALWTSRGELAVVDTTELDRGGTIGAAIQLEQLGVRDARWAGDALVIVSSIGAPRQPFVQVTPVGQLPREPDELKIDVEWTTDGSAPRMDIFGVPMPAQPDEPAATQPDEPAPTATEQAPATTTEVPPPPAAPIPASIAAAQAHVRAGQHYTFTGTSGDVRTWEVVEVLEVPAGGVVYTQSVALRGTTLGEPTQDTWRPRHPERIVQATKERREQRTVGDVTFDCIVTEVGDTVTWTAVKAQFTAFPGVVRYERGGKVMWELTGVE